MKNVSKKEKKMQENKKLLMIFAAVFDGDKTRPFVWARARARYIPRTDDLGAAWATSLLCRLRPSLVENIFLSM